MTAFSMIFPKISDHYPKISKDFPRLFRRPDERSQTFSENFRKLSKMSQDCRRLPKMFRWYTNEFKYNLRDKLDITEIIDIFTCEDIISSHVRISYRFYQFVTTRYTTDFYIIKFFTFMFYSSATKDCNWRWSFLQAKCRIIWRHSTRWTFGGKIYPSRSRGQHGGMR